MDLDYMSIEEIETMIPVVEEAIDAIALEYEGNPDIDALNFSYDLLDYLDELQKTLASKRSR